MMPTSLPVPVRCSVTGRPATQPAPPAATRRSALVAGLAAVLGAAASARPAAALGLESIATPLDRLPTPVPGAGGAGSSRQKAALAAADEAFASSDLLRTLKERSAANSARNRKAIQNKYCARQAELGIGDCGGLRYVPGATKSGKQKTPKALLKLLGKSDDEAAAIQAAQEAAAAAFEAAKEVSE